jgi:hypothetical protein
MQAFFSGNLKADSLKEYYPAVKKFLDCLSSAKTLTIKKLKAPKIDVHNFGYVVKSIRDGEIFSR